MAKMCLVFTAIALTLSSVTCGFHSNAHQRRSFENIWDVPRIRQSQKKVVPGADNVHFLAKGSHPYSSSPSTAWPKPDALIQCGAKNMTLQISRRGSSPLYVNQDGPWVKVFQKFPQCSSTMSRRRRSLWPPYYGCDISKKDGQAAYPVRVAGTPLVIGCPFPPRKPTVDCADGLSLQLGGVSVVDLKIKVMGHWYPLMAVCRWCALSVEHRGKELSLKAPFKGACTETKDGVHSISLRSGDAEMAFSCTPPPPTYPPYPFPHTHFPWPNIPHLHQSVKPPFPWPIFPPSPKPLLPWQTIPFHVHPTQPGLPWPSIPTLPIAYPWTAAPTPPPVYPWPGVPTPPPAYPWPVAPTPPPAYPWPVAPTPPPAYPWPVAPTPPPAYPFPGVPYPVPSSQQFPVPISCLGHTETDASQNVQQVIDVGKTVKLDDDGASQAGCQFTLRHDDKR